MAEAKESKTKKVFMMVQISGTVDGEDWPEVGGSIVLSAAAADRLVQNNQAVTPATWAGARKKRG